MLSQSYSRFVFWGLLALVPLASLLGWDSREVWGGMLLASLAFTLLLLDALGGWRMARPRPLWTLTLFAGVLAAATLTSTYRYPSLVSLTAAGAGLAIFSLARNHGASPNRQQWLAWAGILSGTAVALQAAWEALWLPDVEYAVSSTFGWKNALAGFLTFTVVLALNRYLDTTSALAKTVLNLSLAVMGAALFATNSQAAWLAVALWAAATVAVHHAVSPRRWASTFTRLGTAAATATLAIAGLVAWHAGQVAPTPRSAAATIQKIVRLPASSIQSRSRYWQTSWEIARDFPWLGVGPGNFTPWYARRFREPWLYTVSPHNYLLTLAVTAGFAATLAFAAFAVLTAGRTVRWLQRERRIEVPGQSPALVIAWATATGALLTHAMADLSLEVPSISLLWWMSAGLLYANFSHDDATVAASPAGRFSRLTLAAGCLGLAAVLLVADNWYRQAKTLPYFGTVEKRLRLLQRSRTLMPLSADTAELLAETHWDAVLQRAGDRPANLTAMLQTAQRAAQLDPISAHRQWYLGYTYYRAQTRGQRYWPQVITHFQQAVAYDFHDPTYYRSLAEAYAFTGSYRQALRTAEAGISLYPPEEIGRLVFGGIIYEQLGLKEKIEALETLRGALQKRLEELEKGKATQQP